MISKILKHDRMLAQRIILALTTGMMLTCSAKISFGQTAPAPAASESITSTAAARQAAPAGR